MKATGIVRRIDDLGRVVIPKEIRRTMRIREGDPFFTLLTPIDRFCVAVHSVYKRTKAELKSLRFCSLMKLSCHMVTKEQRVFAGKAKIFFFYLKTIFFI